MTLLSVENLTIAFRSGARESVVVEDASISAESGEIVGLVGESGSGKSVTARAIMRLLPEGRARVVSGRILFENRDLVGLSESEMRQVRGGRIGMIFQEPMTSLNPVYTVGWQIEEALRLHTDLDEKARRARALELLRLVGIGSPERRYAQHPHELSGGLRQRVMIAVALSCGPRLLIADEPTTALDVTVQAQVLDLIARLGRDLGMAVLLISHDLGVIARYCSRIYVMYAGRVVETGASAQLFAAPRHRYTEGLIAATPRLDAPKGRLPAIPGSIPGPGNRPGGCPFHPRCAFSLPVCAQEFPPAAHEGAHVFACWNPAGRKEAA